MRTLTLALALAMGLGFAMTAGGPPGWPATPARPNKVFIAEFAFQAAEG